MRTKRLPCTFRGMTLLEILVVVAIVSIMLGGTALSLSDGGRSRAVGGSVPTLAGSLGSARNQALATGEKVRLVIDSVFDATCPDNYLRRFVLMHEVVSGTTTTWETSTKPVILPKGVYFSPEFSLPTGQMSVKFGMDGSQYYYEFDESGQLSPTSTGINSARMVVTSGFVQDGVVVVPDSAKNNRDGVMIHRLGRVSYFQNPSDIAPASP